MVHTTLQGLLQREPSGRGIPDLRMGCAMTIAAMSSCQPQGFPTNIVRKVLWNVGNVPLHAQSCRHHVDPMRKNKLISLVGPTRGSAGAGAGAGGPAGEGAGEGEGDSVPDS